MAHDTASPQPPIDTHCPNPACARVHRVKGKYAGMRGRCPACASWMYVPLVPPASRASHAAPPAFGWAATLFLLLGMAGLGALAAAPLLPGHAVAASGDLARTLGPAPAAVAVEARPYAVGVPLALLALPLGALLTGAVYRRPTALGLLLTYAAVGLSSVLAFIAVVHYHDQMTLLTKLEALVRAGKESGASGDAAFQPGPYLYAGLAGAVGAAGMFLLAAFALHRRFWSRLAGAVLLGVPLAVGAAWVYRKDAGLDGMIGFWETR